MKNRVKAVVAISILALSACNKKGFGSATTMSSSCIGDMKNILMAKLCTMTVFSSA